MPPDPPVPRGRALRAATPQPHPTFWWLSALPLFTHVCNLPPRSQNHSYAPELLRHCHTHATLTAEMLP